MTVRHIRFSEIIRFKGCRRSWMNGYYHGMTKPHDPLLPQSGKRDVGTIVDVAIRNLYHGDVPLLDTWETFHGEALNSPAVGPDGLSPEWQDVFDLTHRMLEGYQEWLEDTGEDAGERTVGTEIELEVPIGNFNGDDVFLTCHIDRVLIDAFGAWVIEDTKTVDTFAKDQTFAIDDQLLTYAWAWNRLGLPRVSRVRHNMLRKVKRTARAKPPFYKRTAVNLNDEQLDAHTLKLLGSLRDMVHVYQALDEGTPHQMVAYPRPSKDCSWWCDFESICVAHDDGTDVDALRNELYVPYPEVTK